MIVILASASPRRKELLERAGITFKVRASDADESPLGDSEDIRDYLRRVSLLKAYSVFEKEKESRDPGQSLIVLAADTIVWFKGRMFGKPEDRPDAENMLRTLSGETHTVMTCFSVLTLPFGRKPVEAIGGPIEDPISDTLDPLEETHIVETEVTFRDLRDKDIERYLDTGEYADKAGAYAIQGPFGQAIVDRVKGSYPNIIGLPLGDVLKVLRRIPDFEG
jgi:septum formation protein